MRMNMLGFEWIKVAGVILAAFMVSVTAGNSWAAGDIPIPDFGKVVEVEKITCEGLNVVLEVRYYDFVPVDPHYWRAEGYGLPGEPNFAIQVWLPEHNPVPKENMVYIDADVDGKAEEFLPLPVAAARYDNNWCVAYEKIRHKAKKGQ